MTRRAALAGLAAMAALSLPGSSGAHPLKEGGTFRVGIPAQFAGSIEPTTGVASFIFLRATCAGLLTFADRPLPAGNRIVPEVATDYPKISNGGKTYTFKLRSDFRFSTGKRVTAADFAHTINRLLNPAMASPQSSDFAPIAGAQQVIDGKAQSASGVIARGDTLTIELTKPVVHFSALIASDICVLPASQPVDPEGVRAPVAGAGPYYVSQYVPAERVVLERNRYYRGDRPHHVDRFVVDLTGDSSTVLDEVERGDLDYGWMPNNEIAARADELKRKYGVNKTRFFIAPDTFLRMFVLNTSRPLFRGNAELRRAVNFAIDRTALQRERGGPVAGTITDQYLPPGLPSYRNVNIYPLRAPNVAKARLLARGHTRSGKAVLYVPSSPLGAAQAQIVQRDLAKIGLAVEIKQFPSPVLFDKLATRGEPFDIGWIGWKLLPDPGFVLDALFDGRTIGQPSFANYSYFNSQTYNRLLDRAARIPFGRARNLAYRDLDLQLTRDAAPAIAYSYDNRLTLVGPRVGCVVVNPELDLAAVCLK